MKCKYPRIPKKIRKSWKLDDNDRMLMKRYHRRGYSFSVLAEMFKVSKQTAYMSCLDDEERRKRYRDSNKIKALLPPEYYNNWNYKKYHAYIKCMQKYANCRQLPRILTPEQRQRQREYNRIWYLKHKNILK